VICDVKERMSEVPAWAPLDSFAWANSFGAGSNEKALFARAWCGGLDRAFLVFRIAFLRSGIKRNRQSGRYEGTAAQMRGIPDDNRSILHPL
jgi:hypothetical protein